MLFGPEGIPPQSFEIQQPMIAAVQTEVTPDFMHRLFDLMLEQQEINPNLSFDQAKYQFELAEHDPRYASLLMYRLTRPSGFDSGGETLY